jgi:hypothetical protein
VDRIQVNATHQAWFDPDQIHTVIQCLKKR